MRGCNFVELYIVETKEGMLDTKFAVSCSCSSSWLLTAAKFGCGSASPAWTLLDTVSLHVHHNSKKRESHRIVVNFFSSFFFWPLLIEVFSSLSCFNQLLFCAAQQSSPELSKLRSIQRFDLSSSCPRLPASEPYASSLTRGSRRAI